MANTELSVQKAPMHVPSMDEVVPVLNEGLKKNFTNVSVSVVDCPDLTQKPFMLASEGLCGSPRLADIGGPPYLIPLVQRNKVYKFPQIAKLVELPDAFMIGAGGGPHQFVGVNSEFPIHAESKQPSLELFDTVSVDSNPSKANLSVSVDLPKLMNNVKLDSNGCAVCNNAFIAKVSLEDGSCILEKLQQTEFALMGNFLCSEGKPGKVIEVKASQRIGSENFMSSIRKTLNGHYGNKPVALGGVFLVEKGKANLHIMPDFSATPLKSQSEVDNWLKFYEMDAPLVCVGELVSHDPDLDLRVEHFHCFSEHGQGGHYHYDTTPNEVEYRGYFVLADNIYRIDRPGETTQLGR